MFMGQNKKIYPFIIKKDEAISLIKNNKAKPKIIGKHSIKYWELINKNIVVCDIEDEYSLHKNK